MGRVTYTSNGVFPGHKLRGNERYAKLYHYTSFESFVKIWLSKSLKFSSIKDVNDILESSGKIQASDFRQMPLMKAYCDLRLQFKQISFTMDYDSYLKGCMSPCMWGYYADRKNGVCIELEYDKLHFAKEMLKSPVIYREYIPDATVIPPETQTIKQLLAFIRREAKKIFFTKHLSWKGENEYRIVSHDNAFLDISGAISAIHLTSYSSDECLFVEKLVNGEVPVKYLHYTSADGRAVPVMSDTQSSRKTWDDAKNNENNVINILSQQAHSLYEEHKNDGNFPLILQ